MKKTELIGARKNNYSGLTPVHQKNFNFPNLPSSLVIANQHDSSSPDKDPPSQEDNRSCEEVEIV